MSWAVSLQRVRDAVALADPSLVELPSLAIESAAQTLAVPGQTGFAVNMSASAWVGERQRQRVRVEHAVTVDLIATAQQHGQEHATLARVLDLEQAVLSTVLEVSSNPGVSVQWAGSARGWDESRVYLLTQMTFALTSCEATGANS